MKALDYHEATKHSWARIRAEPHYLDFENMPSPFKIYSDLDRRPLPKRRSGTNMPALSAVADPGAPAVGERVPSLEDLAQLLSAVGITKRRLYPGGEVLYRGASCTGALYHVEVYIVCGDLEGLPAGVHQFQPDDDGAGAARAIRWALEDAGIGPDEVDYINAHGTSTPLNDASETNAIKAVFGEGARAVPISSTKSMLGHSLGASGAIEAVVAVRTIEEGVIHPTVNYTTPDPECDLDYVPNAAREADVRTVLSNSFGFGGQNACLVFSRYEQ